MKHPIRFFLGGLAIALAIASVPVDGKPFHGGKLAPSTPTPPPGGFIANILVGNLSGSSVSNQPVSVGFAAAPAALPSGYHYEIRKADGSTVVTTAQQDAEATWKQTSGDGKMAALSFVEPDTITAGSQVTYKVYAAAGAPNRTAAVSIANITGNTSVVLKTSFNLVPGAGTGTPEIGTWDLMDVNYVINSCPQWSNITGFGSNPACGWQIVASGPAKLGLHLFMYAKRESDNAIHKWIRTDFWMDARGSGSTPCPCSFYAKVSQPNVYGPLASGTVGSAGGGYVFGADLYNGGTRIPINMGGPNDSRAASVTFDSTNVDIWGATGAVVFPGGSWVTNMQVQGAIFGVALSTSGGTLPSALTANQPYFIDLQCRSINNCFPFSTTKYGLYNYQQGPKDPSGNNNPRMTLTNNGSCSSNCTAFPVVTVNPWTKTAMAGTDGGRIWIGANGLPMAAPPISQEEDFTYLTQTAHVIPPYITNLWGNFPSQAGMTAYGATVYYPNSSFLYADYNVGGDNPSDVRIGQVDNYGALALFAPFDAAAIGNTKNFAAGHEQLRGFMVDETTGLLPVMNHGHANSGVTYAHMGTLNDAIYNSTAGGGTASFPVMVAGITGSAYWGGANDIPEINRYQPILEPSHMPMPSQAPYLLTGLPEYLDQMQSEAVGVVSGVTASASVGGGTYYRALGQTGAEQTRGIAWGERILDQADLFTPDADVASQYLSDLVKDNYAFNAAMITHPGSVSGGFPVGGVTSYEAALGLHWNDTRSAQTASGAFQPWMDDYLFQVTALQKLRGEYGSDVTTSINYFQKFAFGRMDPNQGGCLWAGANRLLQAFAPATYDNYFDFTTLPATFDGLYTNASSASKAFTGTLSGHTLTVTSYGSYGGIGIISADTINSGNPYWGPSVIVGSGVPANTTVLSSTAGGSPFTVSGAGGTSSGPFITEIAGQFYGALNPAGVNPGAPAWAGCTANSAVTPLITDTLSSAADSPNGLISIQAMTLAYASWLGLTGATADYNFVRGVQYAGANPSVNSNTGASGVSLSFYDFTYGGSHSSNAVFALGPPGSHYP